MIKLLLKNKKLVFNIIKESYCQKTLKREENEKKI